MNSYDFILFCFVKHLFSIYVSLVISSLVFIFYVWCCFETVILLRFLFSSSTPRLAGGRLVRHSLLKQSCSSCNCRLESMYNCH